MPKYSTQLIVQANPDNTISTGSTRLAAKAVNSGNGAIPILEFPSRHNNKYTPGRLAALRNALKNLDGNSRLYIRGHGNSTQQTVGGVGWNEWAETLVACGLPSVSLISICACKAGRDASVPKANDNLQLSMNDDFEIPGPGGVLLQQTADSFASNFHRRLGALGVRTTVFARVFNVQIGGGGGAAPSGGKSTGSQNTIGRQHHRVRSKLGYSWTGARQVREWVLYGEDAALAGIAGLFG